MKSKVFWKHFVLAGLVLAGLLWGIFSYLEAHTDHGEFIEVPDFTGLTLAEIRDFAKRHNLRDTIIDSVYNDKMPKGTVVAQDPVKNSKVKHNRMIYLYVNSKMPQMVAMPNLVDASPRQAFQVLETYGLKYKSVSRAGLNCVLEQKYKGQPIKPGTMIPKGSKIELVIGTGEGGEQVLIPCLSGLTRKEANDKMVSAGLSEGAVVCPDCKTSQDTATATVYKQVPGCCPECETDGGSSIDIYLTLKGDSIP
ncbi:MAG: PASTA domain-containing protein [Bacteroidota bacterium]